MPQVRRRRYPWGDFGQEEDCVDSESAGSAHSVEDQLDGPEPPDREAGGVTVEAAIALAVLALVLVSCLAGLACMIAQIRCADAAREAARLAGRGDSGGATGAVAALAPEGAVLDLTERAEWVVATVSVRPVGGLLPGVSIGASATAAREAG